MNCYVYPDWLHLSVDDVLPSYDTAMIDYCVEDESLDSSTVRCLPIPKPPFVASPVPLLVTTSQSRVDDGSSIIIFGLLAVRVHAEASSFLSI